MDLDIDGVTALLVIIHQGLAQRGGQHWAMPESEAKPLVQAAGRVLAHYDVAATQKMTDIGMFASLFCAAYLPRLATTVEMRRSGTTITGVPMPPTGTAQIFPFVPAPPTAVANPPPPVPGNPGPTIPPPGPAA